MNKLTRLFLLTAFFVSPVVASDTPPPTYGGYWPLPTYGNHNPDLPPAYSETDAQRYAERRQEESDAAYARQLQAEENAAANDVAPPAYQSIWQNNDAAQPTQGDGEGALARAQHVAKAAIDNATQFAIYTVRRHPKRTGIALLGVGGSFAYAFPRATSGVVKGLGSLAAKVLCYSPKLTALAVVGGAGYVYVKHKLKQQRDGWDEFWSLY